MKNFVKQFAAGIALGLLVCGLATSTPSCATVPIIKDCSAETAVGLIDDVNTAVATKEYKQALSDLVIRWGTCAVKKAVAIVLNKIGVRAKYDSFEAQKEQRLRDWMAEQPLEPSAVLIIEEDTMQQALVTHSKRLSDVEIACIAEAVNEQLIECAQAYGVDPQPMAFYSTALGLPASNCRIMDIVDTIDVPGAAGYHTNDFGIVYGRVLAQNVHDTAITVSHEALEMLIDPSAAVWRPMPDGFAVAHEVCDPVQGDCYPVEIALDEVRRTVMLSNYVLPKWFIPDTAGPFDRMGKLSAPFQMSAGGYLIVRDASGKQGNRWARFGGDRARIQFASKFGNPDARLARRLAG